MAKVLIFSLFLLTIFVLLPHGSDATVTVTTSRGIVNGYHVNLQNSSSGIYYGEADVFMGVPYVRAPIGSLRFQVALLFF